MKIRVLSRAFSSVAFALAISFSGNAQAHIYEQWELDNASDAANAAFTQYTTAESAYQAFNYDDEVRKAEAERDAGISRCNPGNGLHQGDIGMCVDGYLLEFEENVLMIGVAQDELYFAMQEALNQYLTAWAEYEGMLAHNASGG